MLSQFFKKINFCPFLMNSDDFLLASEHLVDVLQVEVQLLNDPAGAEHLLPGILSGHDRQVSLKQGCLVIKL